MFPKLSGCIRSPWGVPRTVGICPDSGMCPGCARNPRDVPGSPRSPLILPHPPAVPPFPRVFSLPSTGVRGAHREYFRGKNHLFPSKCAAISCAVWTGSRLTASSPRERSWGHIYHVNTCPTSHSQEHLFVLFAVCLKFRARCCVSWELLELLLTAAMSVGVSQPQGQQLPRGLFQPKPSIAEKFPSAASEFTGFHYW